jgi:hypothetical protein
VPLFPPGASGNVCRSDSAHLNALGQRQFREDDVPISVKFDVAALRARELAQEKRVVGLRRELGIDRDAAGVLLRFGGLEEVVAPDDVREANAHTAALAWISDDDH